jgi:hypothetical protein
MTSNVLIFSCDQFVMANLLFYILQLRRATPEIVRDPLTVRRFYTVEGCRDRQGGKQRETSVPSSSSLNKSSNDFIKVNPSAPITVPDEIINSVQRFDAAVSLSKQCAGCTSHLIHLDSESVCTARCFTYTTITCMGLTKNNTVTWIYI